jgi:ABC-type nitrate/sulfonate/bicarbonate transport system substrate-binding protein
MFQRKRIIMIFIGLLTVATIAFIGGILGKREGGKATLRCFFDGTRINPIYEIDAFLDDSSAVTFCSTYCATRWFTENRERVVYFRVTDEITGQKFDSTLGFFVESEVVTVPEVKNRIHIFATKEDAMAHARQFNGRVIKNPIGDTLLLPQVSQFDTLKVGAPSLPDAVPLKLAVFKPIFKENRVDVTVVPFEGEKEVRKLLSEGSIEAAICDLPEGILLAIGSPTAQIIRNVLRANPYRPLFALVAGPKVPIQDLAQLEGQRIAIPQGVSFRFYAEYFLMRSGVRPTRISFTEVEKLPQAWDLLSRGKVSAAVLRTPYTEFARAKGLTFLADDRTLPWMSVLLVSQPAIQNKPGAIRKFLRGFEQSVLALNLQPDQYRSILQEKGGIPPEIRRKFPMPIFEGANAPSESEVEPVIEWLVKKGLLRRDTTYGDLVNPQFLPNPKDVGLAFCCR